jgi:phosphoribosylglycinamide formyltransferase-1
MVELSGNQKRFPHAGRPRWAVLISGRGSNLASLFDQSDIDIRVVYSSIEKAEGLLRARRAGLETKVVPTHRGLTGKTQVDYVELTRELRASGVTHILLAGYMKIVPKSFVNDWKNRIVNLHPSMLPLYPGLNSIRTAFDENADIGVTIHEVTEEVDAGRRLAQRKVIGKGESSTLDYNFAEFLVHIEEQRLLRLAVSRWGVENYFPEAI